jgi:uncharacterized protein
MPVAGLAALLSDGPDRRPRKMQARRLPFQEYQHAFTAHIRDPRANPRPAGVPARRMRIYNALVFNNLEGFLLACFPVSRQVLGPRRWRRLVRAFFASHRCRTPFFRQIPEEFVEWLRGVRAGHPGDPPFLPDLAHYEWVELALGVSPLEPDWTAVDRSGDLLTGRPALNPVAMLLTYPYAVHRIGPRFRPKVPDPQPTHLLVFRDLQDQIRFVLLNAVSARLVAMLHQGSRTGSEVLEAIARELDHPDPGAVIRGGQEILHSLRREDAVLGTWR